MNNCSQFISTSIRIFKKKRRKISKTTKILDKKNGLISSLEGKEKGIRCISLWKRRKWNKAVEKTLDKVTLIGLMKVSGRLSLEVSRLSLGLKRVGERIVVRKGKNDSPRDTTVRIEWWNRRIAGRAFRMWDDYRDFLANRNPWFCSRTRDNPLARRRRMSIFSSSSSSFDEQTFGIR